MKPVPAIHISLDGPEDDMSYKFCSKKCSNYSTKPPRDQLLWIVEDSTTPPVCISDIEEKPVLGHDFVPCCDVVSSKHQKVLQMVVEGKNWAGYTKRDEISLCIGQFPEKKLYVVHHARSITGQILTEFFVSPELCPSVPLSYIPPGVGINDSIQAILDDNVVQPSLQQAIAFIIHHSRCDNSPQLVELLSSGEIIRQT